MANTDESMRRWNQLAAELQAYQANLDEAWGDLDDVTIAKYLSGTASREEIDAVKKGIQEKPAIRELIDVVSEVFAAVDQPEWKPQPATASQFKWRTEPFVVLGETLQVWLDRAGQLMARGLESLAAEAGYQPAPEVAGVPMGRKLDGTLGSESDATTKPSPKERCWRIQVEEAGYLLTVRIRPATREDAWELRVEVTSDADPDIAGRAEFAISRPDDSPIVKEEIAAYADKFIEIGCGKWELTIQVDDDIRVLPLEIGSEPGES